MVANGLFIFLGVPEEFLKGEEFFFLAEEGLFGLFGILVSLLGVTLLANTGVLSLLGFFQLDGNFLFLLDAFDM